MAKNKTDTFQLNTDTLIEVIAIKDGKPRKKEMTFAEALKLPKLKGWNYIFYQIGFSQFKIK